MSCVQSAGADEFLCTCLISKYKLFKRKCTQLRGNYFNNNLSTTYKRLSCFQSIMGCDGGTIPKRNEIVKNKQKNEGRDKNDDLSAKWQFCYLSGLRLQKPIVACLLGHLYNKDAILEYLLGLRSNESASSSSTSSESTVAHIKSLSDVKELKFKEKPDFDKTHQASSGNEQFKAQFVCPISGLDMNGNYKFYYISKCGCVLSERALKEVPDERHCILCSKPYDPKIDLIVLNGNENEVSDLKTRLSLRLHRRKSNKRTNQESRRSPSRKESPTQTKLVQSDKSSKRHKTSVR